MKLLIAGTKDVGGEVKTDCVNVERRSSSSTSSVLSASSQRQTATPRAASVAAAAAGPVADTQTPAAPGGARGFDLLALQEAMSLASAASSLRHATAVGPPPAVGELLHCGGSALRGLAAPSSSSSLCPPSRPPPAWIYPPPPSSGRFDLAAGLPQELKARPGFASRQICDGRLTPKLTFYSVL